MHRWSEKKSEQIKTARQMIPLASRLILSVLYDRIRKIVKHAQARGLSNKSSVNPE